MKQLTDNKIIILRILYTLCVLSLCVIDWVKESLNGRAQMTATNMTGVVIAVIILSAMKIEDFRKKIYIIWTGLCLVIFPVCIPYVLKFYPYKGQVYSGALNIFIYGAMTIKVFSDIFIGKKRPQVNRIVFGLWFTMLILMLLSINENIWPLWFGVMFGSFYFTDYEKKAEDAIYSSIPDGIILGFFTLQGAALLFRPYDAVRYTGLYINPNINALFYLMTYSALLCKWFIMKKRGELVFFRIIISLFAGAMYGFAIFTGSKTSILAMLITTIPFVLLSIKYDNHKVLAFIRYWIILGFVGIISIPIVYAAIRYMPTIHLHPLYFEGEYSILKVQPGEPRDSKKYVTYQEAISTNAERLFFVIPNLLDKPSSGFVMKVHAAGLLESDNQEYIFPSEDIETEISPLELRLAIYKYYLKRLNLFGHSNYHEEAPVQFNFSAPHAHNVFIQTAFLYGIPAGVLFIVIIFLFIPVTSALLRSEKYEQLCVISCFIISFTVFGSFEINWACGQLSFTTLFIMFRSVIRNR